MRRSSQLLGCAFISLAACGGGKKAPPTLVDAPPVADAPPDAAPVCAFLPTVGQLRFNMANGADNLAGTLDDVPLGNVCNPGGNSPCNWLQLPTSGPNANQRSFLIFAGLPDTIGDNDTANPDTNAIVFEIVSVNNIFLANNTQVPWSTDPAVFASSPVFADAAGMITGTVDYQAQMFLLGNLNDASGMFTHIYSASTGGITLTRGGNVVQNTVVSGTIAASNFREIDNATGTEVAGGCTTTFEGLGFAVTQGTAPAKPAPGSREEALGFRVSEAIGRYRANAAAMQLQ